LNHSQSQSGKPRHPKDLFGRTLYIEDIQTLDEAGFAVSPGESDTQPVFKASFSLASGHQRVETVSYDFAAKTWSGTASHPPAGGEVTLDSEGRVRSSEERELAQQHVNKSVAIVLRHLEHSRNIWGTHHATPEEMPVVATSGLRQAQRAQAPFSPHAMRMLTNSVELPAKAALEAGPIDPRQAKALLTGISNSHAREMEDFARTLMPGPETPEMWRERARKAREQGLTDLVGPCKDAAHYTKLIYGFRDPIQTPEDKLDELVADWVANPAFHKEFVDGLEAEKVRLRTFLVTLRDRIEDPLPLSAKADINATLFP